MEIYDLRKSQSKAQGLVFLIGTFEKDFNRSEISIFILWGIPMWRYTVLQYSHLLYKGKICSP